MKDKPAFDVWKIFSYMKGKLTPPKKKPKPKN